MVPETVMTRDEGLLSLESTGPCSASPVIPPPLSKEAVEAAEKRPLEAKEAAMP